MRSRMKLTSFFTMASAIILNACTAAAPNAVSRLGSDLALSGGTYTSGGGITVAAEVRTDQGLTLVCGVWAQSNNQSILTKHVERQVLGTGAIFLGKDAVVRGLNFMDEVPPSAEYSGQVANCIRTERVWQISDASKSVKIRIPRQVVYFDGGELNPGPIVYFKPTGPAAGG